MERVTRRKRERVEEVLLIWPGELPPHVQAAVERIKHSGARVSTIWVRPGAVGWVLSNLDKPLAEVPPMIRPLVSLMQRHGARELPALIVDGRLAAAGEAAVLAELAKLA